MTGACAVATFASAVAKEDVAETQSCSLGLDVANLTGVVAARVGFEELELFLLLKERLGLIKPTSCSFRLGSSSSQAQSHAFE